MHRCDLADHRDLDPDIQIAQTRSAVTTLHPNRSPSVKLVERSGDAPAGLGGKALEEVEIVGTLWGLADRFIDLVGVPVIQGVSEQ